MKDLKALLTGKTALLLLASVGALLLLFGGALAEEPEAKDYRATLTEEIGRFCEGVAGVGEASVFLTFSEEESTIYEGYTAVGTAPPRVMGVAVACRGGDNPAVVAELKKLLSAALGCPMSDISVSKKK